MRVGRLFICAFMMVSLLGCVSGGQGTRSSPVLQDGAPSYSVDVSTIPEVKVEPVTRTRAGNKNPYTVLGKTYELLPDSRGYDVKGIASWYGTKFHGRKTSNGEVFNMYGLTAAHKFLPIPTYAEVTNLNNGKKIIVRINDRGPFHDDRTIDLSWAAAEKLGFAGEGTAPVRVVALDPDATSAPLPKAEPLAVLPVAPVEVVPALEKLPANSYYQIAVFSDRFRASQLAEDVEALTKSPVLIEWNDALAAPSYKVFVGPLSDRRELPRLVEKLQQAGLEKGFVVQLRSRGSVAAPRQR